jgi:hypothetical protein
MQMIESTRPDQGPAIQPLKPLTHVVVGLAIGLISPVTVFAWPFAILVGIVIGRDSADRAREVAPGRGGSVVRVLAVTGGVLAMLVAGALIGGLIAFVIVALAAFSERAASHASDTDRVVARLILFVVPILMWVAFSGVGFRASFGFGS